MSCRAWTRTGGRLPAIQSTVSDVHGGVCIGLAIGRAISRLPHTSLRASLGQPLRLHPASVLAGLATGAGPAALPCSYPLPTGCMASRCVKGEGCARHPHPFPTLCSGLRLPVPPLTPLPARITTRMPNCAIDSADDESRGWCGPQPYGRGHGPLTRQECPHAMPGGRCSGPSARNPCPRGPAGEGGESREAKPLWEVCITDGRQYFRQSGKPIDNHKNKTISA